MQTSRFLPAIVIIALCASVSAGRADDTPAQAAARAALMGSLSQTGNSAVQVDTNLPQASFEQPSATPPPATPAPVVPPVEQPVTTPPVTAALPPLQVSTNLTVPPVEQESVPTNQVVYPVNPPMTNTADQAAARAALMNSMGTPENTASTAPSPTQPGMIPSTPTKSAPAAGYGVMTAPPLPISQSQQEQLQALLQQYMANQITPVQYQEQRAKIMAGQ